MQLDDGRSSMSSACVGIRIKLPPSYYLREGDATSCRKIVDENCMRGIPGCPSMMVVLADGAADRDRLTKLLVVGCREKIPPRSWQYHISSKYTKASPAQESGYNVRIELIKLRSNVLDEVVSDEMHATFTDAQSQPPQGGSDAARNGSHCLALTSCDSN
jgi:hypothetical protein